MNTPKPAPSKPLTFTPPQFIKDETRSSELPAVDGAESNVINKKQPHRRADGFRASNKVLALGLPEAKVTGKIQGSRPQNVIIDEAAAYIDAIHATEKPAMNMPKPFVFKPHLTQRPFHDDRLMQLKNRLQRPSFKNR